MSTRACIYCGKRIRFVTTAAGKLLPVNLDPDPAGNVVMRDGMAHVLTAAEQVGHARTALLMPHQATCGGAGSGRHRRR